MDSEILLRLDGAKKEQWAAFLRRMELDADENTERTVLLWENGEIIACGSRMENLLKCIAVDPAHQGEGLTASLLTLLRQDAFAAGHDHLFLYTKPKNEAMFAGLFFYPVAKTGDVLLMENRKNGIGSFLDSLSAPDSGGTTGAIVMHCNPFTLGHRYLVETAARQCHRLLLFVLSEEGGPFPAAHRLELVKQGTADLPNVTVLPTGPYLISSATFPTYFLKDKTRLETIQCQLDAAVFTRHFAPRFSITRRFVGTEPLCAVTENYNRALKQCLPPMGVEVTEIPRLEKDGAPISASRVRSLLGQNRPGEVRALVPETTFRYLQERHLL